MRGAVGLRKEKKMRLFYLEIRRVLTTRLTWGLLAVSLLLSVGMGYLPVTFESYSYQAEDGSWTELKGLRAVRHMQSLPQASPGEVTPQLLREVLENCQDVLRTYGKENIWALPREAFCGKDIILYSSLLSRVNEAAMRPDGTAPGLLHVTGEQAEQFYDLCRTRLEKLIELEQAAHPAAGEAAQRMYEKVGFPFFYEYGLGSDSMDYQTLLIFMIAFFCVSIAAPVFSADYQTGADDIQRCAKYGRIRLGIYKILSALLICGTAFLLCMAVFLLVTDSLFGWKGLKNSMQVVYSVSSLLPVNLGGLQLAVAAGSLLFLLSLLSFTLFLSSKLKNTVSSLAISLVFCMLPVILSVALPERAADLAGCILPGGGIGIQNSLLCELTDFHFLHFGDVSFWKPWVMLAASAAEAPVFLGLALHGYCRRRM